jgi:phosphohistidine phosphatase SixA
MKTLLVLRHGKSSWSDPTLDDHERPLNKRGRRDGPRMGKLVRKYGLMPDVVISSDAVRARLTAEAVVQAARYAGEILLDQQLYMASPAHTLSLLRTVRENAEIVMIVGHKSRARGADHAPDRRAAGLADGRPRADCLADRSVAGSQTVDARDALGALAAEGTGIVETTAATATLKFAPDASIPLGDSQDRQLHALWFTLSLMRRV